MKRYIFLISIILLSVFLKRGFSQTVDEVIDNHAKAMGGADKLLSLRSIKYHGKISDNGVDVPTVMRVKREGKARVDMTYQGMDMIRASNGIIGWFLDPFQGKKEAEKMPSEQIKQLKKNAEIEGSLINYKQKGYKVELYGLDDFEGSEVYKIKLTDKDGDVTYYYIDASSNLILKQTSKRKVGEKEISNETIYGNYQKIDGIMIPMSIEFKEIGSNNIQITTVEKIELNADIDDEIFEMPDAKQ